jgi:hypothetical protein
MSDGAADVESLGNDGNLLVQVRLRIPDQPGSLGRVARVLGEAGGDIVQVVVLERGGGWALDDFTVCGPSGQLRQRLPEVLAELPDVQVEGIWRTLSAPGRAPDAELLAQAAIDPAGGLVTLVESVPDLVNADWAVVVDLAAGGEITAASHNAPDPVGPSIIELARSQAVTLAEGTRTAVVPIGSADVALVVVRGDAPPFHPVEISRLAMLAHVIASLGRLVPRAGDVLVD